MFFQITSNLFFIQKVDATVTFFIVCSIRNVVFSLPLRVQTTSGLIEGYRHSGVNVYFGIPYAQPPIGKLRFRKPESIDNWSDTYKATHPRPSCYQELNILYDSFGKIRPNIAVDMSENCLYIDVWVPEVTNRARLATMVWIHGDKFGVQMKKFEPFDGRYLAYEYGVIVVSVSYRVGVLGYLYTGNGSISGNMGIHDKILAIRWLHQNVENFGGDRYKLTLFGEGKGAAHVSLLLLSPFTNAYINNAILQSGSVSSPFFFQKKSDALRHAKRLANNVGCTNDSPSKMVDCLTEIDITKLIKEEYIDSNRVKRIGAYPVRDEAVLRGTLGDVFRKNKVRSVNLIVGVHPNEMRKTFIRNRQKYLRIYVESSQNTLTYFERTLDVLVPINNVITRETITEIYLGSVLLPEDPDYTGVLENIGNVYI